MRSKKQHARLVATAAAVAALMSSAWAGGPVGASPDARDGTDRLIVKYRDTQPASIASRTAALPADRPIG